MHFPWRKIVCCALLVLTMRAEEMRHWSMQPIRRVEPPEVVREGNAIDGFIRGRLGGLAASPEAAPGVLVRRLYFNVVGLPPSPEEVARFERGEYDALVERLLASPAYGEKWARHWLDAVRFAETHGFEMNQPRANAWLYRDYVIGAFNRDLPYDRFILEQLAGDVLGVDEATGFLVAGPWDQVKSPDPVLTANQRADELHDIVSTTSSTFLGLTVGCARCHDHKFDPISQVDYFGMKAVFEGVQHGERELRDGEGEKRKAELASVLEALKEVETRLEETEPLVGQGARRAVNAERNVERFAEVPAVRVRFTIHKTTDAEPCIDELEVYDASGKNVALASLGVKASASGTYPNSEIHRLEHINDGRHGNGRSWISNEPGRGWVELEFPAEVRIARIVWGRDRELQYRDRLATDYEIQVWDSAGKGRVVASDDDRQAYGKAMKLEGVVGELAAKKAKLQAEAAQLRSARMVYAGVFNATPEATHRLHRGDPMLKREVVAPGALKAVGEFQSECEEANLTADQRRRLALARWIADARNPLTARVMVNRIWQYHFGAGLAETPSDFGVNGAKPTHPELLDWLASELIANGWSVKHIQRLILKSATFKQASAGREDGMKADAGTRLLWRYPPRRLEAETIRDSILAVSGKLDRTMGGPGFSFFEANDNYVRVYEPRMNWPAESFRRMVYGTVVRQRPDGVFGVFDCPDGGQIAPKRTSSTTPLQALNLLNSTFIQQQAEFFAKRLEAEAGGDPVGRAFELAFQRRPEGAEREEASRLVEREGLGALCRALFNANEFVYVF